MKNVLKQTIALMMASTLLFVFCPIPGQFLAASAADSFVDNCSDFSKIYDSTTQCVLGAGETSVSPVENPIVPLNNNNWDFADGWGLIPLNVGSIPYVVYKFEEEIDSFNIDTVYANSDSTTWATDFVFEVSADNSSYVSVDVSKTIANGGTTSRKKYNWKAEDISSGNYYLKITFGNNTAPNRRWAVALDTVKVTFKSLVSQAASRLSFSELTNEEIDCVTSDITLKTEGFGGTEITSWESSNPNVLSDIDGTVNTDVFEGYKCPVTLTATISDGTNTASKKFEITVVRDVSQFTDSDFVELDLSWIEFEDFCNEPSDHVISDITLPEGFEGGSSIVWSVIDPDGAAQLEGNNLSFTQSKEEEKSLTIRVTATYGMASDTKDFPITVPKMVFNPDDYIFIDDLCDYSKMYDSSPQYPLDASTVEGDGMRLSGGGLESANWYSDCWGIGPINQYAKPWIVYKFDYPIYSFNIDALYTHYNQCWAEDLTFRISENGTDWVDVENVDSEKETVIANNIFYKWVFEKEHIDTPKYYYLKVQFGDSSNQGHRNGTHLDTVTVRLYSDVDQAYNALKIENLTNGQDKDSIMTDITLPSQGAKNTQITWTSSQSAALATDGTVNQDGYVGYGLPVTLTASITDGLETQEKIFNVTLKRDTSGFSDADYVEYDLRTLEFSSFTNQPSNMVAADILLPTGLEGGSSFTWSVTDPDAVSSFNGNIISFAVDNNAAHDLVLTVTSTYGAASDTKDFPITVMRGFSDNLILNASVNASSDGIRKALSKDLGKYWETAADDVLKQVSITFPELTNVKSALVVEKGNNITNLVIRASEDGNGWKEIYTGTSKGDMVREPVALEEMKCKYVDFIFYSASPISLYNIELYDAVITDEQIVSYGLEDIKIPASTSTDITLPTVGKYGGTITWTTSNANVITNTGVITQAVNENKSAVLTAVLSYKGVSSEPKTFTITVSGKIELGGGNGGSGGSGGGGGGGASGGSVGAKEFEEAIKENTQASSAYSFADVSENHWAHSYITELTTSGIISKADNYRPSDKVTREEFVKLIIAATGGINSDAQSQGFTDTDNTAWYYPYIAAAHDRGIVTGNVDGSFGIGTTITRQDAAAMLYRAIENKNTHDKIMTFTDGGVVSVYAAEAITYLANEGILSGYEDGSFRPFDNLTRAESAKIIYMLSTLAKEDSNAQ